ncbi:MAG: hypothetical protein ACI4ML_03075 [Aristaeellaceae bacterium]
MPYQTDELPEAKRQLDSILHKLRSTVTTLEGKAEPKRYASQITLAKRRIRALEIACELLEQRMARDGQA